MKRQQRSSPARSRSNGNGAPSVHRQTARPNGAVTAAQFKRLSTQVTQMQGELDHIKKAWGSIATPRQGVREQVEKNGADLGVQFQRIAMMQAEIDRLKADETALRVVLDQLKAKKNPPVEA